MSYIDLLMEAVNVWEQNLNTQKRKDKLRQDLLCALKENLITKQDAEEINEIADLKLFE